MSTAVRVVFDTNVLLSLFVFADSRFAPLRQRLAMADFVALTDERCLAEFRRVLAYPMFALDPAAQAAAFDAYASLAKRVSPSASNVTQAPTLPRCSDTDDQKFLEVARDGQADWLVTSDKALLKLARRQRLAHLFRILKPEQALEIKLAQAKDGQTQ